MGADREAKAAGSQWPIVASVGQRVGPSYRNCVDSSGEPSKDVAHRLVQSYDFSSGDEGPTGPDVRRSGYPSAPRALLAKPDYPEVPRVTSDLSWVVRIWFNFRAF